MKIAGLSTSATLAAAFGACSLFFALTVFAQPRTGFTFFAGR
jgi:hypothetical protein